MKKMIVSLSMVLIFILVILTAGILNNKISNMEVLEKTKGNTKVSSELYKIDLDLLDYYGIGEFKTSLPVLHINTGGEQIVKARKTWATLGILKFDENYGERNVVEVPDISLPITINLRGASSYSAFDKNQYRIEFYKEKGDSKSTDYNLLGMGEHSEWVLNGPFLDVTMMRNHLIYKLAREIFEWAPQSRYCEVFVDGKYQGIYLAVEPVSNGRNRLNLSKFGLLTGETSYIINRDRVETKENPIDTYGIIEGKTYNSLYISHPSYRKITKAQREWIKEDISKFEKVLYSHNFADGEKGYKQYIDMDNFVDYFIFNEVVMNRDAGNLSTYVYKDLGGSLKLAVWDYNNAYDNYQWFESDFSEFRTLENSWFDRLVQDRNFVEKVVSRYYELRKGTFDKDHMYKNIDIYEKQIEDAVERNFAVWGYMFNKNMMNDESRMIKNYDMAIKQLKDAIEKRFEFLDNHIEDLYLNCIN